MMRAKNLTKLPSLRWAVHLTFSKKQYKDINFHQNLTMINNYDSTKR